MGACMQELVAIGASAAANCHPCMEHHLAECDKLGIRRDEVLAAVRVGLMISHGADPERDGNPRESRKNHTHYGGSPTSMVQQCRPAG